MNTKYTGKVLEYDGPPRTFQEAKRIIQAALAKFRATGKSRYTDGKLNGLRMYMRCVLRVEHGKGMHESIIRSGLIRRLCVSCGQRVRLFSIMLMHIA